MLELGLRPGSCLVFEGTSFSCENSPVSSLINQPNTFLLYPGKGAICLDNLCCMKDGQESAGEAMTLVLLDGSWREAKAILRNSPLLQTLPRLTLKDGEPSEYVVRSQPALGGLQPWRQRPGRSRRWSSNQDWSTLFWLPSGLSATPRFTMGKFNSSRVCSKRRMLPM